MVHPDHPDEKPTISFSDVTLSRSSLSLRISLLNLLFCMADEISPSQLIDQLVN
jgi:hypothetical protein